MKFLKLTKFKTNPDLVKELADKISGDTYSWQKLDFTQYPSIMQMLSDNNLNSVVEVTVSTNPGPMKKFSQPVNDLDVNGAVALAPFRVYIPLSGVNTTFTYGDESMEISEPTAVAVDEEFTSTIDTEGASHMLRITIGDSETTGRLRYLTGTDHKMEAFAKFSGLV